METGLSCFDGSLSPSLWKIFNHPRQKCLHSVDCYALHLFTSLSCLLNFSPAWHHKLPFFCSHSSCVFFGITYSLNFRMVTKKKNMTMSRPPFWCLQREIWKPYFLRFFIDLTLHFSLTNLCRIIWYQVDETSGGKCGDRWFCFKLELEFHEGICRPDVPPALTFDF